MDRLLRQSSGSNDRIHGLYQTFAQPSRRLTESTAQYRWSCRCALTAPDGSLIVSELPIIMLTREHATSSRHGLCARRSSMPPHWSWCRPHKSGFLRYLFLLDTYVRPVDINFPVPFSGEFGQWNAWRCPRRRWTGTGEGKAIRHRALW